MSERALRLVTDADVQDEGPPMSPSAFAAKYGYSRSTVYTMLKERILGCHHPPKASIRIYPHHEREFLEKYECPAQSSKNPTTVSSPSPGGETGTLPGPKATAPGSTAQGLRFKKRAQRIRAMQPGATSPSS